jgi:glc operon protein GlcG
MNVHYPVVIALVLALAPDMSLAQEPIPYGAPITLDQARKLIAAAEAKATTQRWPVAIAIVDGSGHLVAFARMDNTQLGSIEIALDKAKCAALFRRPTRVFEEALAKGGENLRALKAPGIIPIEGGVPIIHDGKIVGAIGVSGVKANEDGQVAKAGADAIK